MTAGRPSLTYSLQGLNGATTLGNAGVLDLVGGLVTSMFSAGQSSTSAFLQAQAQLAAQERADKAKVVIGVVAGLGAVAALVYILKKRK